jgi:EAL domain-containing protein (putative c-di-GMP-specific phosphodiesterase class I)
VAERVLAALRAPLSIAGTPLPIGASLGIASTDDALTAEELLRNADLAMYASKSSGRNRITPYRAEMHEAAALRMQVHRGLRRALDEGHLALHYQPIVELPSGEVIGGEALLRWRDPDLGPISPEVFIPIAEESGIISEIDGWVLGRACRDIRLWLDDGVDVPRISVNVSRRHMTADLPRMVAEALSRHGLTGERLCIEVTETAVVPDADLASAVLHGVRALGVTVSLDDFGAGESSLSQLARLPVDTVKIDRSFTRTAVADAGARRLLISIVRVCQSLSLPVVAEGIETRELAHLLADMGCLQGQGWYFARDAPADAFSVLVAGGALPVRTRADHVRAVVA